MTRDEQIQQELWELVYELLPSDQAASLRERIASDPQLARAYSTAKLQTELLGAAAQLEDPQFKTERPSEQTDAVPRDHGKLKFAQRVLTIAATLSFAFVGYALVMPRSEPTESVRLAAAQPRPLEATVTVPGYLHSEVANPFLVQTFDSNGAPAATDVEYRVYDSSNELFRQEVQRTDGSGLARFELPATGLSKSARVEVSSAQNKEDKVSFDVAVRGETARTHLSIDKPFYRRGEVVQVRSVTLRTFNLSAVTPREVNFHVEDAAGAAIPGSASVALTEEGVGTAAFPITDQLPPGNYAIVASTDSSNVARRKFYVRDDFELPHWSKEIELERDSYGPGDRVVARFRATVQASGAPARGLQLSCQAFVDGESVVSVTTAATNEEGLYQLEFQLPDAIQSGDGFVTVTSIEGDKQETAAEPIPIHLGKIEIDFFPEGGELVANVPNRVYFFAHDSADEPVHVEARVLDDGGNETALSTAHRGRGRFVWTPQRESEYRLIIDRPRGTSSESRLPAVASVGRLSLNTGKGVFSAGESIAVTIHAPQRMGPVVVMASCRQAVVGLARIEAGDFDENGEYFAVERRIPLAAETGGVVRVTAFDYSAATPVPLAERLVFCRPRNKIEFQFDDRPAVHSMGDRVTLSLTATDEHRVPQRVVLGASVVSEGVLQLAQEQQPSLPAHFYLLSEIVRPGDLDDAQVYLADGAKAEEALDLLLGTQGWRRFDRLDSGQLAQLGGLAGGGMAFESLAASPAFGYELREDALVLEDESVPKVFAATVVERASSQRQARSSGSQQSNKDRAWWAILGLTVTATLLALILVFGSVQRFGHRPVWLAVGSAAILALVAFALWPLGTKSGAVSSRVERSLTSDGEDKSLGNLNSSTDAADASDESELSRGPLASKTAGGMDDALSGRAVDMEQDMDEPLTSAPSAEPPLGANSTAGQRLADQVTEPPASLKRSRIIDRPKSAEPLREQAPLPASGAEFSAIESEEVQPAVGRDADDRFEGAADYLRRYSEQAPQLFGRSSESDEVLLWLPLLFTDNQGRQTITFELPREPSTFRLRLDAHGGGRLGVGEVTIRSSE